MGCDYAQGYFFSRPQPPDVVTRLLRIANNSRQVFEPSLDTKPAIGANAAEPLIRVS